MKKKFALIFLFVCMLFAVIGIFVIITHNFDIMSQIFSETNPQRKALASQLYIGIALLLTCWVLLLVLCIKNENNGTVLDYGMKDVMTGIGNVKYLEKEFKKTELLFNQSICVAYIGFEPESVLKQFNSALSEKIQKGVAQILVDNCGENDRAARIQDGIFALTLCCSDGLHAEHRINSLINKLNKYEHQVIFENVAPFRAGLVISPDKNFVLADALKNAKTAYDFANDNKVNSYIFSDDLVEKKEIKSNLKKKFFHAMEKNEFEPFMQFVYDIEKQKFVGAEILSRWNSPDDGFVMPAYYINDMFKSGVIEAFDMYMLKKTCEILEKWSKEPDFCELLLSCNITRVTIASDDFSKKFRDIISKYKFDHNHLILEITEDALIDDQTKAHANILECKELGFVIALDDFGSGNTSFTDISNYPIDQIKIDRQFVSKSTTKRGSTVLQGLIELAHRLDIQVVCEGVENSTQMEAVKEIKSDYIQGYYYSYVFSEAEGRAHFLKSLEQNL